MCDFGNMIFFCFSTNFYCSSTQLLTFSTYVTHTKWAQRQTVGVERVAEPVLEVGDKVGDLGETPIAQTDRAVQALDLGVEFVRKRIGKLEAARRCCRRSRRDLPIVERVELFLTTPIGGRVRNVYTTPKVHFCTRKVQLSPKKYT